MKMPKYPLENGPSTTQWKRLFELAVAVKEMAPWDWMLEEDIFGVQLPDREEPLFVSVMGALGEHFAVAIYPDHESAGQILHMMNAASETPVVDASKMLLIPQIQCSFEDRNFLTDLDRQIIKTLGLKFRGKNAWPQFRTTLPGYFPWYISGQEADLLIAGMERLLEIAPKSEASADDIFYVADGEGWLVLTQDAPGGEWREEVVPIRPISDGIYQFLPDADLQGELDALPTASRNLIVDFMRIPSGVQELPTERPRFPFALMVMDEGSGMIMHNNMFTVDGSYNDMVEDANVSLCEFLIKTGWIPRTVFMGSEFVADHFGIMLTDLGAEVRIAEDHPVLRQVQSMFSRFMM